MGAMRVAYMVLLAAVVSALVGLWALVLGQPLTLGEMVIAIVGFIIDTLAFAIYLMSGTMTSFGLPIFLTVGSVLGAQVGPKATNRLNSAGMRYAFAAVVIALGLLTIVTTIWPVQQPMTPT